MARPPFEMERVRSIAAGGGGLADFDMLAQGVHAEHGGDGPHVAALQLRRVLHAR